MMLLYSKFYQDVPFQFEFHDNYRDLTIIRDLLLNDFPIILIAVNCVNDNQFY